MYIYITYIMYRVSYIMYRVSYTSIIYHISNRILTDVDPLLPTFSPPLFNRGPDNFHRVTKG